MQRTTVGGVNLTWLRADGFEVEIEFEPSGAAPLILVDEDDVIDAGRLGTADGEALLRRALAGFRRQ